MTASPLPDTDWDLTREFWAGAARAELMIPRCAACSEYVWYPREQCPACDALEVPWVKVSGRGTLAGRVPIAGPADGCRVFRFSCVRTSEISGGIGCRVRPRVYDLCE